MTLNLDTLTLETGGHTPAEGEMCLMEAVSYFAGEPFSDTPQCVSPVLRDFGVALNDRWDDDARQKLKPLIPLVIGTAGDGQDEARSYLALDWLIRTYTPAWLDLAGLTEEAAQLRALRRIVDLTAAQAAGPVVRNAREKSAAAGAAAGAPAAAAGAAAADAAWDAAGDAAAAAAAEAAWAAAGAAAADAAWAAAWAAAGDVLRPTVEQLQDSAVELFKAMCDPASSPPSDPNGGTP